MGYVAARRPLWRFARDSFGACRMQTLARYQLANAMHAFTVTDDPRAAALARAGLSADLSQVSSWDLFRVAGHCAFLGLDAEFDGYRAVLADRGVGSALGWRIENLALQRARLKAAAVAIGCGPDDLGSVIAAARARPVPAQGDRVQIGILSYANPTTPSTNIGDPIQTLGALGQLTAFDFEDLEAPEGVADLLALGGRGPRQSIAAPARIVTVDRDYAVLQAGAGRIWLPVCGWFTHEVHAGRYVFPLPSNILPIYMSLHIAQPEILTAEAIEHLKACAPIGCRDINTVRLLRNLDVPAFFNGCVTLTLDRLLTRHDPTREGGRAGRYFADYNDGPGRRAGEQIMAHLDDQIVLGNYGETLSKAAALLASYRKAEAVRTPLLHCYLPCRALRTEVEFTNRDLANPRFEGLIGISEEEVVRIVERFEAKYATIMAKILGCRARCGLCPVAGNLRAGPGAYRYNSGAAAGRACGGLPRGRAQPVLARRGTPSRDRGATAGAGRCDRRDLLLRRQACGKLSCDASLGRRSEFAADPRASHLPRSFGRLSGAPGERFPGGRFPVLRREQAGLRRREASEAHDDIDDGPPCRARADARHRTSDLSRYRRSGARRSGRTRRHGHGGRGHRGARQHGQRLA